MNSNWLKVSKHSPCPICGRPDWCRLSRDGAVALCGRISQGSFKAARCNGGYFHRLGNAPGPACSTVATAPVPVPHVHEPPMTTAPPPSAGGWHPDPLQAIVAAGRQCGGQFVAAWTYHNRDGSEAMRVVRYSTAGGKTYRPIHPSQDGWRIGDPPGELPLYRLKDLILSADNVVHVCEGEKAADAAVRVGLTATTSAHGCAAAERTDWTPLAGRRVCILPDADQPGARYAQDVARRLSMLTPPAQVRIVHLPGLEPGGDIVDYIDARDSSDNADLRSAIHALADATPPVDPAEFLGGPVMLCVADVAPRPVSWLWPGRVALGRITLLVGRPGEGKSWLTIDMAARISTATPWPDGQPCPGGSVIMICAEDNPHDTIRPRLDAHRADCRKVHLLSAVRRIGAEGQRRDVMFSLDDVAALESALRRHPDCKLIVVDPIGSFLGGQTDAHRDNEVRSVLAPVARLAESYGAAVLVVAHRRKSAGSSADDMALGSRAFTGIARAVWHLSRDRDDRQRRLLLPGKNNLAPDTGGLAFRIAGEPASIQWERTPVQMSADDALEEDTCGRPPDEREEAVRWLREQLADGGDHLAGDLRRLAQGAGLSWRTVQRAAMQLGVMRERGGVRGGVWRKGEGSGE